MHIKTVLKPGCRVEVQVPELAIGAPVERRISQIQRNGVANPSNKQWNEWLQWTARHPKRNIIAADDRECIYEGRGD
jgi:hypothetical protein